MWYIYIYRLYNGRFAGNQNFHQTWLAGKSPITYHYFDDFPHFSHSNQHVVGWFPMEFHDFRDFHKLSSGVRMPSPPTTSWSTPWRSTGAGLRRKWWRWRADRCRWTSWASWCTWILLQLWQLWHKMVVEAMFIPFSMEKKERKHCAVQKRYASLQLSWS